MALTDGAIIQDSMTTLKELREAAVLSQGDLAARARVARTTINEIENGTNQRRPRPSTIRRLAKALKVRPQEIEF